jgi:hypothetical protein
MVFFFSRGYKHRFLISGRAVADAKPWMTTGQHGDEYNY